MSSQKKVEDEISRLEQKKRKSMSSLERVRLLQLKLYQKAKQEKGYRFYILYDKLFQGYVLEEAYKRVRTNGGSPGVDRQTFRDVDKYGRGKFLQEIGESIRKRTYKPDPVKRVWIEKENGGQRPLGIPTIRDRVAQQCCKLVLEPIFEADFDNFSYGFRPKRSAADAVREIGKNLKAGNQEVYDADLSKYFDTIPHDKLLVALKERVADPRVLHLINLWLKTPIVEEDGKYSGGRSAKTGTPQGGVISPLLSNIYLNLLDRIINKPGNKYSQRGIKMIRYADDFILMSRHISEEVILEVKSLLARMGLKINDEKSKLVCSTTEPFDFLGFTFKYAWSILKKDQKFWRITPRLKSEKKIRQNINEKLKRIGHYPPEEVVATLNPIVRGWMNYYKIEKVSHTQVSFKKLEDYLRRRIDRYFNRKSQRKSRLHGPQAFNMLVNEYGLIKPYRTSGLRPVNAR